MYHGCIPCQGVVYGATMKTLTEGMRVNITTTERQALEELAAQEQRSVAFMIRRFIREGLEREATKQAAAA